MPGEKRPDLDRRPIASDASVAGAVPVIGIGPLRGARPDDPAARRVAAEISAACHEWGFFHVVDHGVDPALTAAMWRQTHAFFALPAPVRRGLMRTRENPWGYYDRELTKNSRDKKEVFDYNAAGTDDIYGARNRWPAELAALEPAALAWLDACTGLGRRLLSACAQGLGVPAALLRDCFRPRDTSFVRLNHYPVHDPLAGVSGTTPAGLGVHHHTDAGALTLLVQDGVAGLQVYRDDAWHTIAPRDGALVVNTGDMLQVWSNDYYPAALHRVVAMERTQRYSLPCFFNPAADCVVEPLSGVNGAARYRPISWREFRGRRTDGDYADYGAEVQIDQYRL